MKACHENDTAKALFLEQAAAYYDELKLATKNTPYGKILANAEAFAVVQGRELLRYSLEHIVQDQTRQTDSDEKTAKHVLAVEHLEKFCGLKISDNMIRNLCQKESVPMSRCCIVFFGGAAAMLEFDKRDEVLCWMCIMPSKKSAIAAKSCTVQKTKEFATWQNETTLELLWNGFELIEKRLDKRDAELRLDLERPAESRSKSQTKFDAEKEAFRVLRGYI